ncbi:MAG: DUF433 domain-containing protein [Candidatus Jordarchaeaceae archaeon]
MEDIIVDPNIMAGKPIIKGTRIPVDAILRRIAEGMTIAEILEEYPNLTKEKVKAALEYAERIVRGEDIIPIVKGKHEISSG